MQASRIPLGTRATFIIPGPVTRSQTRQGIQKSGRTPRSRYTARAARPGKLITDLQTRLQEAASPTYAKWLSRYLRDTPCRGLKTPAVERVVGEWVDAHQLGDGYHEELFIATEMFKSDWNEDKLAGTMYLSLLQRRGRFGVSDLGMLEVLFDDDYITPWNTVDQLCARVLAKAAREDVEAIAGWVKAENVWRARAGVVGLLSLLNDEAVRERCLEGCGVLVKRRERFAKTGVGWALRELCKWDESAVVGFLEEAAGWMSIEATRNACKHMSEEERGRLLRIVKEAKPS